MPQSSAIPKIDITVKTMYLANESNPANDQYAFAYTIAIRNQGSLPARLLSRHWIITNANGKVQEVAGKGVVGEQPYLNPGETFEYTSGTLLNTPYGTMQGRYHLITDEGEYFEAEIPPFQLVVPNIIH